MWDWGTFRSESAALRVFTWPQDPYMNQLHFDGWHPYSLASSTAFVLKPCYFMVNYVQYRKKISALIYWVLSLVDLLVDLSAQDSSVGGKNIGVGL